MWKAESGKLKCATKIAAGGFPVAVGCHRAIELARGSGSGLRKYYKTRNRPVHHPHGKIQPSREGKMGINAEARRTLRPAKIFESPSGWHICRKPNQWIFKLRQERHHRLGFKLQLVLMRVIVEG
jgi:hypothetical protein